ncbi:MAG TPA: nucleoside deaminase [Bryobacteraceae bacterium]|nr:nucleoside deaminase [Bryobacteraceae bacterium]
MTTQQRWMLEAVDLAVENVRSGGGGPFAALVVRGGDLLASGTNLVTSSNDPTAHAEIVAIRRACERLGAFQLTGCEVYTTCEPCPMCLGAIYWARPDRVWYGATRADAARAGFDDDFIYKEVSAPVEERKLPMRQIDRDAVLRAFREWELKPNKVRY